MFIKIFSKHIKGFPKDLTVVLQELANAHDILNIPFFIVGAFARDLIMQHLHNFPPERATKDIDFAVIVDDWEQYKQLVQHLTKQLGYKKTRQTHRLASKQGILIDLIPFGKIAAKHKISWPPHFDKVMNMLGYPEVYQATLTVRIDDTYNLKIASLEGLVILKLIAWQDLQTVGKERKHIHDILYIMEHYYFAHLEQIAIQYPELIDAPQFDEVICGAEALGRNVQQILNQSKELKKNYVAIGHNQLQRAENSPLIQQMIKGHPYNYVYCFKIWAAFCRGITHTF